jgi:hypothetical protein
MLAINTLGNIPPGQVFSGRILPRKFKGTSADRIYQPLIGYRKNTNPMFSFLLHSRRDSRYIQIERIPHTTV